MKRVVARLFASLVMTLAIVSVPVAAHAGDCSEGGSTSEAAGIGCTGGATDTDPAIDGSGGGDPVYTVPGPWTEYKYVPNCSVNAPEGGADALCGSAVYTCPEGELRYRVYTREREPGEPADANDWEAQSGTVCRGADDPVEGGPPVITEEMVYDAASAVVPESSFTVEPANRSYVNVPNNVAADAAGETTVDVEVLGVTIPVTFDPTDSSWDFGDGSTGTGDGIKNASVGQAGAVEHVYTRQGSYDITLTTTFEATAQLPGGDTLEFENPFTSTSDPYTLPVGEIQSVVTGVR